MISRAAANTAAPAIAETREQRQLHEASRGFEQMFLNLIWQESRRTVDSDDPDSESPFAKSHGERVFQGMLDQEYAGLMSQRGGLGLAELIEDQLSGRGGVGSAASYVQRHIFTAPSAIGTHAGDAAATTSDSVDSEELPTIGFAMPVAGRFSSSFGLRSDPFTGELREHGGVDIAAAAGTPVAAAAAGKVTYSGWLGSFGRVVILEHQDGYKSIYGHLSETDVLAGQELVAGQPLGKVGSTGRSTGPHLHFEVARNGVKLDPGQWLSPGGS